LETVGRKILKRGLLVAIEGIDGAGKTTQTRLLVERLMKNGYSAITLHEPTNGQYGQRIKEIATNGRHKTTPEEESELFYLDRIDDVQRNVKPALHQKKIVVMDRYYFSNIAYQSERGLDPVSIEKANEKVAPIPDVTIILDLDPEVALERITHKRNSAPNHFEKKKKLDRVRQVFLKQFGNRLNVTIIRGDDKRPIQTIASDIWKVIEPKIKDVEESMSE